MGIMFTTGNSGGIISSVVYRTQDKPKFRMGHGICLAFAGMAVVLSLFMRFYLAAENRRRDEKYGKIPESVMGANGLETSAVRDDPVLRAKYGLDGMTEEEIELLGDKSPFFRYVDTHYTRSVMSLTRHLCLVQLLFVTEYERRLGPRFFVMSTELQCHSAPALASLASLA